MSRNERNEGLTQEVGFNSKIIELNTPKNISPEEFSMQFPWLSRSDAERFEAELTIKYPDNRSPLSSFLEKVDLFQNPANGTPDIPVDEFCGLFSITEAEALEFGIRKQDIHGDKPLASFIQQLKGLPIPFRDLFARRHINAENFRIQQSSETSE